MQLIAAAQLFWDIECEDIRMYQEGRKLCDFTEFRDGIAYKHVWDGLDLFFWEPVKLRQSDW